MLGIGQKAWDHKKKEPLWSDSRLGTQNTQLTVYLGRHTNKTYMNTEYDTI